MKVLVAVDGSAGSFEAVRQAGALLSPERDSVVLYYSPPSIKVRGTTDADILERARGSLSSVVFAEAKTHLPEALQASAESVVGERPAKQGIVASAETHGCTLIAVGARGLGPIDRLLLGSVSGAVVHSAHVPVLVARPRDSSHQSHPFKVLLAVETAKEDSLLAEAVNHLSWPAGTIGLTMSVVHSLFAGNVPKWLEERARSEEVEAMSRAWVADHEAEIATKRQELVEFTGKLPPCFQRETPLVIEGHPAERILETLSQKLVDLVVVGARKPSAMARWLLGSTSETILSHAHCSVLVVRELGSG